MKFLAIIFALQVLVLNLAPAFNLLPEWSCHTDNCAGEETPAANSSAAEPNTIASESCNPFCCTACCFLTLPAAVVLQPYLPLKNPAQLASFVTTPPLESRQEIWHPPRLA